MKEGYNIITENITYIKVSSPQFHSRPFHVSPTHSLCHAILSQPSMTPTISLVYANFDRYSF